MADQDLSNITLDQQWIDALNTKMQAVIDHLLTKAVSLTTEQRQKHPGIGPQNSVLVEDGVALVRDNADWFPGAYQRTKLLSDVATRALLLQSKGKMMQAHELFFDTLQAVSADIVNRVRRGRSFIESGAELTGMNNVQVTEYLEWFKRFGKDEPPATPETPEPPVTP